MSRSATPPPRRGRCATYQEALSARHDDEPSPPAITDAALRHHLDDCAACAAFAAALPGLRQHVDRVPDVPVPALTTAILTEVAAPSRRGGLATFQLRWLVGIAGIVQLLLAVPLLAGVVGPDVHAGRDLGVLQLALGVGLALSALQPRRASGVLPIAAVVASATVVVAVIDIVTGAAALTAELTHVSELVGVVALWSLSRRSSPDDAAPRVRVATS